MADTDVTPKEISRAEAREMLEKGAQLVDVRADHEWEAGHLPGAVHIALPELPARVEEIDKDRTVILYCRGGNRSVDGDHRAGGGRIRRGEAFRGCRGLGGRGPAVRAGRWLRRRIGRSRGNSRSPQTQFLSQIPELLR